MQANSTKSFLRVTSLSPANDHSIRVIYSTACRRHSRVAGRSALTASLERPQNYWVRREGDQITSRVLAGTVRSDEDSGEDGRLAQELLGSDKDQRNIRTR